MSDLTVNDEQSTIPLETSETEPSVISSVDLLSNHELLEISKQSAVELQRNETKILPPGTDHSRGLKISASSKLPGRENAFSQLVKGWESYMSANDGDPFQPLHQPLQMLQGLTLCNPASHGLALLTNRAPLSDDFGGQHPLAPPALRHIHSTPNQYTAPMMQYDDNTLNGEAGQDIPPPPAPLDPFQRSSSTPSAFKNRSSYASSFGTESTSAFTSPSQRFSYTGERYYNPASHRSAFDPVKYYTRALEDMERTSIEVTAVSPFIETDYVAGADIGMIPEDSTSIVDSQDATQKSSTPAKRGAAFRAARFLTDVRVLRRKRRIRNGRENPSPLPEVSFCPDVENEEMKDIKENNTLETSVMVVTETTPENPNDTSALSRSSELSAIVRDEAERNPTSHLSDQAFNTSSYSNNSDQEDGKDDDEHPASAQYQQLDSDVDEEDNLYRRIDLQLHVESPVTIPSPTYQNFLDERILSSPSVTVVEHESLFAKRAHSAGEVRSSLHVTLAASVTSSPNPTAMDCGEETNLTPRSNESCNVSPCTARSFGTGSSSGHSTHATSVSSGPYQQSGLSTISETDREVMETNKGAKRRRGLDRLPSLHKSENDGTSLHSSSTGSTNPLGYLPLGESPVPLRDGANLPLDRFFSHASSSSSGQNSCSDGFGTAPALSSESRRSGATTSPTVASESVAATNTSSSNCSEEEPLQFVSYLDREFQADFPSFRETNESSSERVDDSAEREPSPAPSELVGYTDDLFEESKVCREQRMLRLEKFRTRPPRSPGKGLRHVSTPPPRGSISPIIYQQLSPPRNIVDLPDSNISRPYVKRSGVASFQSAIPTLSVFPLLNIQESAVATEDLSDPLFVKAKTSYVDSESPLKGCTYEESSIEIVNTDFAPNEVVPHVVTPEKEE